MRSTFTKAIIAVLLASLYASCTIMTDTPCQNKEDCPPNYFCFASSQCLPLSWRARINQKRAQANDAGPSETLEEPIQQEQQAEKTPEPSCSDRCNPKDKPRKCYPQGKTGCNANSGQCQGLCTLGEQSCVKQEGCYQWSECINAITPDQELCDNQDNDCDGSVDEDCDCKGNETKACYTFSSGCTESGGTYKCTLPCAPGTAKCDGGTWGTCTGDKGPTTELCDNKDNDCDGNIDNGLKRKCYTGPAGTEGVGPCKGGEQTCQAGSWLVCKGEILPEKDTCNAVDDDCDGTIDEDCIISTLAGNGGRGSSDGTGAQAQFHFPGGMAIDAAGNIFVADTWNHLIRKVEPSGKVTYVAGSVLKGYADGPSKSARFNLPGEIAIDKAGNLYIADGLNYRLRKLDASTDTVSTIAGTGTQGFKDDSALSAQFSLLGGLLFDLRDDLIILDTLNHRIRKLTQDTIFTIAGTGTPGHKDGLSNVAQLNAPSAITIDAIGNLFFADNQGRTIRKLSTNSMVTTVAGTGIAGFKEGPALQAQFQHVSGLAFDKAGNLLIADLGNKRIRRMDKAGLITTIAGTGKAGFKDGPALQAELLPQKLLFDNSGNLIILGRENHSIRKMTYPR